jgi:hypothetical protein
MARYNNSTPAKKATPSTKKPADKKPPVKDKYYTTASGVHPYAKTPVRMSSNAVGKQYQYLTPKQKAQAQEKYPMIKGVGRYYYVDPAGNVQKKSLGKTAPKKKAAPVKAVKVTKKVASKKMIGKNISKKKK